jgi:beta-mannosidase
VYHEREYQLRKLPSSVRSKHFGTSSWLIFDGLDTFAEVTLCDEFVANTNNQYLQYVFDVSDIVRKCSKQPVLELNFGSAPKIAIELGQSGQSESYTEQT